VPSARTIRDLKTVLRSALSTAISEELIDKNVAALVKTPRVRQRKGEAWTSDEARRFLESARDNRDSLYAMWVLILVLGLRKGEVLGLAWPAVDLDRSELTVEQQLQRVRRELLLRETKTEASDGVLALPEPVQPDRIARTPTTIGSHVEATTDACGRPQLGDGTSAARLGLTLTGDARWLGHGYAAGHAQADRRCGQRSSGAAGLGRAN
jgi:integrase